MLISDWYHTLRIKVFLSCTGKWYDKRVLGEAWFLITIAQIPDEVKISVSMLLIAIAVGSYALELGFILNAFVIARPMKINPQNDWPLIAVML